MKLCQHTMNSIVDTYGKIIKITKADQKSHNEINGISGSDDREYLASIMLRGSVKYGVIPWGGLVEKFTGNTYTITVGIRNIINAPILNGGNDDFGIGGIDDNNTLDGFDYGTSIIYRSYERANL